MSETIAIGKPLPRIDVADKVQGKAIFTADVQLPGMLVAKFLPSPHAHAEILSIDTSRAEALKGVRAIITRRDLPKVEAFNPGNRFHAILARRFAVFAGQPVAAVAAEDSATAEAALELITVEYQPLPAVLDPREAVRPECPAVSREKAFIPKGEQTEAEQDSPNIVNHLVMENGDVASAFAESDLLVENTYTVPSVHQGYLEPHSVVAHWDRTDHVTVWECVQSPFEARDMIAETLGIPPTNIALIPTEVGGAFGGKDLGLFGPLVVMLTHKAKRPVKLVLSRREELVGANPAPQTVVRLKTGARKDGKVTALEGEVLTDIGAFSTYWDAVENVPWMMLNKYKFPAWRVESFEVFTNRASIGAYRAPLAVNAAFALESQMDEIARRLGIDPLALRLNNLIQEGDLLPHGQPQVRNGAKEVLTALAKYPAWSAPLQSPSNKAGLLRGRGVGMGSWGSGRWPASAVAKLEADGKVHIILGTVDLTGSYTSMAQIAAEALGVSAKRLVMSRASTDHATFAPVSGGSGTIYSMGSAVKEATLDLRVKIVQRAAQFLETPEDELSLNDAGVFVVARPELSCSFQKLYQMGTNSSLARYGPLVGLGSVRPQMNAPAYAASLAEVTVNPETGQVTLVKLVSAQDVGKAINPLSVEGQIQGGATQSTGIALWEAILYGPDGQVLNPTLMDYRMPTAADVPMIETILVEAPGGDGPYGAKGVGEPPIVSPVTAIANAVTAAIGKRICELPITPERVWRAMKGNKMD